MNKKPSQMTKDEYRLFRMEERAKSNIPSISIAAKNAIKGYKNESERHLVEKAWLEEFHKYDAQYNEILLNNKKKEL